MAELQLTPRLSSIATLIPPNSKIADVGTDHALLPISLLRRGIIRSAIASDMREGPLENAFKNMQEFHCQDRLSLRLGAGLERVHPGECDTVVIAGMGGTTIAGILQDAPWTQEGEHTLLLQPMTMIPELRQYLWSHNYEITRELVCSEDRRYYLILRAVGQGRKPLAPAADITECYYSEALLQDPRAQEYLTFLLRHENHVLHGMLQGQSTAAARIMRQKAIVENIAGRVRGGL